MKENLNKMTEEEMNLFMKLVKDPKTKEAAERVLTDSTCWEEDPDMKKNNQ